MLRCKEAAWRRFHRKYLVALRERYNLNHNDKLPEIQIGESKNCTQWNYTATRSETQRQN